MSTWQNDLERKQAAPPAHNTSIHAIRELHRVGGLKKRGFAKWEKVAKTEETVSNVSDVQKSSPQPPLGRVFLAAHGSQKCGSRALVKFCTISFIFKSAFHLE